MKQVAWQLNWFLLHFPNCWQQLLVLGENRGSCSFSIAIIAGWQRLQPSISGRLIIIGLFDKNAAWRAALIKRAGFAGGGEKGKESGHVAAPEHRTCQQPKTWPTTFAPWLKKANILAQK